MAQEAERPRCPKCGGEMVATKIMAPFGAPFVARRERRVVWPTQRSHFDALTCVQCGYTEHYAREPSNLRD